jgi:hypothetical protein
MGGGGLVRDQEALGAGTATADSCRPSAKAGQLSRGLIRKHEWFSLCDFLGLSLFRPRQISLPLNRIRAKNRPVQLTGAKAGHKA